MYNKIFQSLSSNEILISLSPLLSVDFNLKILYHSKVDETNSFLSLSKNKTESQLIPNFTS
ncbi:MAG: hypothetical protein LBQ59_04060 [Candidatus Peribacteria bacterium]|nr:hypothetical protein [Candidatus Peribacteria bacterium]